MGLNTAILMVLGGLATISIAVMSRLLADDIKAWLPKLTDHVIEQAVKGLPAQERERFAEEWRSYVNDTPGDISKLVVAIGFFHASSRMASSARLSVQEINAPIAERVLASLMLVAYVPLLVIVVLSIMIETRSTTVLCIQPRCLKGGRNVNIVKFVTTRSDGVLCRSGIYQFPMLLNVVRGDMSITNLLELWVDGNEALKKFHGSYMDGVASLKKFLGL